MKGARFLVLAAFVASALGGCSTAGGKPKFLADNAVMPDIVAVMPPSNMSNDLAAPDTMRKVEATILVALGYLPVASPAQEEQLRGMGITDGGQLRAIRPTALSGTLHTDGMLFTFVEVYTDLNIGVYRSRRVVATTTLTDALGNKLWSVWAEVANRKITNPMDADAIAKSFLEGMAQKLVEKILKIHLLAEASQTAVEGAKVTPEWPDTPQRKLDAIRSDLPSK